MNERVERDVKWMEILPSTLSYENVNTFMNWQQFYRVEEAFISDLERFNERLAHDQLGQLIDFIQNNQEGELCVKNYLISMSGLVTRRLVHKRLDPSEAFSFNVVCDSIIEQKLAEDNAYEIAGELIEFYMYVLREREPAQLMHETVNAVIDYIDSHLLEFLTVEGIADRFKVSTSHLSRIFREHTGVTLVEYINIRKVEEAQYYLRFSTKRISEISEEFHFCNQSYFTRIFKKYTGETPRRFRNSLSRNFFKYEITPQVI